MRADPVGQALRPHGLGIGVVRRAERTALNATIAELVAQLNDRVFRGAMQEIG